MRTIAAAALAGLVLAGQCFAAIPTPEERYAQATAVLAQGCRGIGCDFWVETPGEQAALNAAWQASQDWTVDWLNDQPDQSLNVRRNALLNWNFNNLNRVAPASIDPVAPELYAVSTSVGEMGNVFLIARQNGRWRVVWDIRTADTSRFPMLKAWRTDSTCGEEDRLNCGPIFGSAKAISPDVHGHLRFVIDGSYAQFAGATVGGQTSFWQWNGQKAEPLVVAAYIQMIDDEAPAHHSPDTVVIRVKDQFQSFSACGSCIGRQLDWTFRIQPDRIIDEGKKPVVPELDGVDAFIERRLARKAAKDLASPAAIEGLDRLLEPAREGGLGLETDRTVARTPKGATVCLSADGLPATIFTLKKRAPGYFISSVRAKGTDECIQRARK